MLLKRPVLDAIRAGEFSLVFRRWRRPTVKAGGTLNTAIGQLAIDAVDLVEAVSDEEAVRAGYANAAALEREDTDLTGVLQKLARLDAREPWTRTVLDLIDAHPGRRAGDLAAMLGRETHAFKLDVRKLKALGLTESLPVGYRLSPRGLAYLDEA